ncbi:MAG: hypothetical protein HY735_20215 [Verrucomicrobia bacterium]|nr:hypothetical protein [Verrucomicrobiota bacterium]
MTFTAHNYVQTPASGNLPDGTYVASMNHAGIGFTSTPAAVPDGKLPTGAGRLPAPPIIRTGS